MSPAFRAGVLAALLLASLGAPAAAQSQPSPSPSATPLPEIGRVVTSDRHDEPISRTTLPTFVVDRAQIEARGDRTIADALVGVPGVAIYHYGGFGAQSALYVHGTTSPGQVLVLLDGLPLAPGSNGEVDLGTLSTIGVRRVEIVEDGGSTLYGTNAIGGVVNIITGIPRGAYLEAASGGYGERDLRAGAGTGSLGVAVERHLARNDYPYEAQFGQPGGVRANAEAMQTSARLSYDAQLGRGYSARLRLGASSIDLGVPGRLDVLTPTASQPTSQDDLRFELAHTGSHATTFLTFGASQQRLAFIDPANPPENDTLDGRAQVSLRNVIANERTTIVAGVDLARESAVLTNVGVFDASGALQGYVTTGASQAQSALYGQLQYELPRGAVVTAGVRGEHDAPLGSVIAPSLGFALPLAAGVRLAANASEGFRVPTIIDLYYPGDANPNLKPERSSDGAVTLQSDRVLGGVSLEWFTREATNLIALDANFVPQNVARASIRGLQGTIHTRPVHGIVATLAVTDTYRALDLSPGIVATRLNFAPVFATSLALDRPLGAHGIGFGVAANVFGPHVEPGALVNDGWTTAQAYVRARLGEDTVLSLRARNLGNERYAAVLGYPAPGRTFEIELATR
jgi:vitamin B12 transporter